MHILETILYTFLTLGIAIVVHEYGHFIVARKCGVFVERFSLGFGPSLIGWTDRHGTQFVISALPLGGYVKMLDSRNGDVSESLREREFGCQNVWKRIAITIAGPVANLLLAVFAFWVLFLNGETGVKPIVGNIGDESPAEIAGFVPEMVILSVNDQITPSWSDVSKELFSSIGTTGSLKFIVEMADSNDKVELYIPVEKWLRDDVEPYPIYDLGLTPKYIFKQLNLGAIMEGSAADMAGLLTGDVVTKINGRDVDSAQIFIDQIESNYDRAVTLDIVPDTHLNALGNHLGVWEFIVQKIEADKTTKFYYQHFFEDTSGLRFNNGLDGLWGFEHNNQNIKLNLLVEYLRTVKSTMDSYYNHGTYVRGWSYKNQAIGNPFINFKTLNPGEFIHFASKLNIKNNYDLSFKLTRNIKIEDNIRYRISFSRENVNKSLPNISLILYGDKFHKSPGYAFQLIWFL